MASDVTIHPEYLRDRGRDFGTMAAAVRVPPGLAAGDQFAPTSHPFIAPHSEGLAVTLTQTTEGTQKWVTGLGGSLGFYGEYVTRAADAFQANDQRGAADIDRSRDITARLSGLPAGIPRDPRVPAPSPAE